MVILERQQKISSARDIVRNDVFFIDEKFWQNWNEETCFCVSLVHSAKRIIVMMTVFRLWRVEAGGKNQDRQWGRIYHNRQSQWQRNYQWKLRNQIQIFRLRYVTEFQQCWNLLITCFIYDFHFDSFSLTCAWFFVVVSYLGLTFKEKWNTSNVLFTEIAIEDQLVKGLKLEFNTSFAPQTG